MPRPVALRASVVAAGLILSGGFATGQRHGGHADIVFADGTHAAGIDFVHVNGASEARHFVEIMGSGGLFFDFDGDGWTDLFLVEGARWSIRRTGRGIVCIAIAATTGSRT